MALNKGARSTFYLAILSISCFGSFAQEHGAQVTAPINVPSNLFLANNFSAKPLSWEWKWNNYKKNIAWFKSNFFGIPRDAKEAQEMLAVALKNNRSILTWAAIISGGLLLASAGVWWYGQRLKQEWAEEYNKRGQMLNDETVRPNAPLPPFLRYYHATAQHLNELTTGLVVTSAIVFLGTFGWRSLYIGKLQEFAAS